MKMLLDFAIGAVPLALGVFLGNSGGLVLVVKLDGAKVTVMRALIIFQHIRRRCATTSWRGRRRGCPSRKEELKFNDVDSTHWSLPFRACWHSTISRPLYQAVLQGVVS